jgi:hypothetical protein
MVIAGFAALLASALQPPIELHGELHGVRANANHFAGEVIARAEAGETVIAAFEISASGQPVLDAWWREPNRPMDADIVAQLGWCGQRDGRVSAEFVEVLEELRAAAQSLPISVRLFDERGGRALASMRDNSSRGSAQLALALARLSAANPDTRVMALVGNLHARKTAYAMPESSGGGDMITAGLLLADHAHSIAYVYGPGSAFNCRMDGCGIHATYGNYTLVMHQLTEGVYDSHADLGAAEATTPLAEVGLCPVNASE